jgi:hypothetical protein
MTILNCENLGIVRHRLATLTVSAAVTISMWGPLAFAEPEPPATPAAKVDVQAAKTPNPGAGKSKAAKSNAAKTKSRSRAAAKATKSTPPSAAKATPDPAAKASQVMDFDNDEVAGKRLEPGFELIEGAPQRARQPSLVPLEPSPQDSVVNRY